MEGSKVEYMAQKQNRVAQHLLDGKMLQIDKELTLAKLSHRMFIKQLRYDMAQFRKSTGHSQQARPPTGEYDTRNRKRVACSLPKLNNKSSQLSSRHRQPQFPRETPPAFEEENSASLPAVRGDDAFFLTQQSTEAVNENDDSPKEMMSSRKSSLRSQRTWSIGSEPDKLRKRSSMNILARIEEARRIINMPSVYQTSIRSQQERTTLNRVLPPIAVTASDRVTETTPGRASQNTSTQENTTPNTLNELGDNPLIRVSFTPAERNKPDKREKKVKTMGINKILQKSLKKASEKKKADERKEQRKKLQTKLAIEEPFGLYRPENIGLIHKLFKQEELHHQHKALLEENTSKATLPVPTRMGAKKLEGKLQAFLDRAPEGQLPK